MSLPKFIRNFNLFADGRSYMGRAMLVKLPQPKIMTEAHRGAGMDAPVGIDMGMEGMTAEFTIADWPPELMAMLGSIQRFVCRPAALPEGGGEAVTNIFSMGGLITAPEVDDIKPGGNSQLKMVMDVRTLKFEQDGRVLYDIDIPNGKRVIDGVDQLRGIRRAMGL